jgi:hypothetical protein
MTYHPPTLADTPQRVYPKVMLLNQGKAMRRLPVDISTFSELRELNCVYVDKTEYLYNMITGGRRYFLSRPRRFGKSLLVSTLYEILTANKKLFDDLWIGKSDYTWQEHGVINLDFSLLKATNLETFKNRLADALFVIAQNYEIIIEDNIYEPDLLLKKIIFALYKQFGRVAILIDEYDSQILKTLHNQNLAKEIRDEIQQFFTTIKSLDAQVQFVFITGVSSFAKAGLFSGINNVQIMTLRDQYAAICGYTDQEVDYYFTDHMTNWATTKNIPYDELRQEIKSWYNGYSFGDDVPKVYNPFSLMNALQIKKFENFWFASGTPTFLIEILKKEYKNFDPNELEASRDFLGIFDVGVIPAISLMFQAGYLTIVGYDNDSELYTLDYPNLEVKKSFQKYLIEVFAHLDAAQAGQLSLKLQKAFNNENIEEAIELIQKLFAHVPYQLHMKAEKFYHALLMMVFVGAGIKHHAEVSTSHGRIDLVLYLPKILYVIEIKFNDSAENALAQIKERRYYEKYSVDNKPIILLGLSFKREPHNFTVTYAMKKL